MSTTQAARLLRCTAQRLYNLVSKHRIPPPSRNAAGLYVWSPTDIDRARRILPHVRAGRPVPAREVAYACS